MIGSSLTAALVRAQRFLLEPAPEPEAHVHAGPAAIAPCAVAVVGMRRGSGASTVASGLTAALAATCVRPAHVTTLEHEPVDATVLIAPGDGEPGLAAVAAELLAARRGRVLVVANRVRDPRPWSSHAAVCLPESRMAALLVARGRLPPGDLGLALRRLAALLADEHAMEPEA